MDTLEARLGKLEGVQSAKVLGYDKVSKFFFNLKIAENKIVGPAAIRKTLEDLKKESKGDEDYPFNSFEFTAITGTVERSGDAWTFTARGTKEKFDLRPNDALKKLVEAGKSLVTLSGPVVENGARLRIDVADANEPAKQ